jgi:hypothetical protein
VVDRLRVLSDDGNHWFFRGDHCSEGFYKLWSTVQPKLDRPEVGGSAVGFVLLLCRHKGDGLDSRRRIFSKRKRDNSHQADDRRSLDDIGLQVFKSELDVQDAGRFWASNAHPLAVKAGMVGATPEISRKVESSNTLGLCEMERALFKIPTTKNNSSGRTKFFRNNLTNRVGSFIKICR